MSPGSDFSHWARRVADVARSNQEAPAQFWESLRGCVHDAVSSLNNIFEGEKVEFVGDDEFSLRVRYNNRFLVIAVDLTTGRVDFHVNVTGTETVVVDEVFRGYLKVRLQVGTKDIIKAEESSFEGLSWLSTQSLKHWPLATRVSQYLLQKLVAPELSDHDFVRP